MTTFKPEERSWQERAEAAEKTVTVLKRRLRAIDAGDEKTLIQRQLEAAQRRAADVERRRALSELRSAELQRYSSLLEREVAARTAQIRTILDHVGAGFLLIDAGCHIEPGFSRSCAGLLGTDEIAGQDLPTLLKFGSAEAEAFRLAVSQVFDDLLPEDLTIYQVPGRAAPTGRELNLSYSVVREDGVPRRLLATLFDVTAQIEAEQAAKRHARLVHILTHRQAFQMYVSDTRQLLREAAAGVRHDNDVFVRRVVHTIKGNSATFGLDELVSSCHTVEASERISVTALDQIGGTLASFLDENFRIIGIHPSPDHAPARHYVLTHSLIETLADKARSQDEQALPRFLAKIRQQPANDFVEPIRAAAVRLGERLEKPIQFLVRGGETLIDPARLGPVLGALPHLVRNAVDHGIEHANLRSNKRPHGTIELSFRDCGDHWEIIVADDGRGIDPERVLTQAAAKGLVNAAQIAELIATPHALSVLTLDGFSTADEVTDVSGRGVGLSAVRQAVEALGGELDLESRIGEGSRFRLVVPKSA